MGYLIGTDEAGYGPNFGPLVVTATAWHIEGSPRGVDLYKRLRPAIVRESAGAASGSVWIADSKAVYRPGLGLAALELGVAAALACCGQRFGDSAGLWTALTSQPPPTMDIDPCCGDFHCPLPLAADAQAIELAIATVASALESTAIRLCSVRSRVVFAREFNALVAEQGGKGAALSHVTIELLAGVVDRLEPEPMWIVCDKHGGRNRYGPLLQQRFPETLVEVRREGRPRSIYRWRHRGHAAEAHFCTRGEEYLAVALASMVSKYLREVAMLAFNRFWGQRVPDLRPTAGYPTDARRFRRDIASAQRELGMEDAILWRAR